MGEDGGQRRGEAAPARVLDGPDVVDAAVAFEVEGERGRQALAAVAAGDHDAVGLGVDAGHETGAHVEALQEAHVVRHVASGRSMSGRGRRRSLTAVAIARVASATV